MDNAIKAALITSVATIVAAAISKGKLWAKKSKTPYVTGDIRMQAHDVSELLIATGTDTRQHREAVHNFYGMTPVMTGPFVGKVATRPSIIEIADSILAAKPYDRIQLPSNYIGLSVSWPVIFSSIHVDSRGTWYVSFDSPEAEYRSVSTVIDISKYPKLKVIEYGHSAWIEGRILHVNVRDIELEKGAEITLE